MLQHTCSHLRLWNYSPAYSLYDLDKTSSLMKGCLCIRGIASDVDLGDIVGIYTSQV